jgi:hypothetical protein
MLYTESAMAIRKNSQPVRPTASAKLELFYET